MHVSRVSLRDFRNYERAELELGDAVTVVCGANGAGKTNLLEALYFGCAGRSCRTSNERELVRRSAVAARVTVETVAEHESHLLEVAFEPGEPKRLRVDGAQVDRLVPGGARPPVSVFMPERLELVKGAPAPRRAHLDQVIAVLWPSRAASRVAYARALAQRNALLARVRAGAAGAVSLDTWDRELARCGIELMADRREVAELLAPLFARRADELGLPADAALGYRPRSGATDDSELAAELAARREADLDRGFTSHGPHRDEVQLLHGEEALRTYGSQGQQRTALLALLFAERDLLLERSGSAPLMLLDDVMSELDAARRERLAGALARCGQAVVTTTDAAYVPGAGESGSILVQVESGDVCSATPSLRPRAVPA